MEFTDFYASLKHDKFPNVQHFACASVKQARMFTLLLCFTRSKLGILLGMMCFQMIFEVGRISPTQQSSTTFSLPVRFYIYCAFATVLAHCILKKSQITLDFGRPPLIALGTFAMDHSKKTTINQKITNCSLRLKYLDFRLRLFAQCRVARYFFQNPQPLAEKAAKNPPKGC